MSHEDIKKLSDAYLSIYKTDTGVVSEETEEQLDEARPVHTMTAKDFGKKIDSIEDVHSDIRMAMVDTISDISRRKKIESKLQKAYDQYFNALAEIERILK